MSYFTAALATAIAAVKSVVAGVAGLWFFPIAIGLAVISIGCAFVAKFVGRKKRGGRRR